MGGWGKQKHFAKPSATPPFKVTSTGLLLTASVEADQDTHAGFLFSGTAGAAEQHGACKNPVC